MLTRICIGLTAFLALFPLPALATNHTFVFFQGTAPVGTDPAGGDPEATLTNDGGVLYGTTVIGGTYNQGTVFKIVGTTVSTLYNFGTIPNDGANPKGQLVVIGNYLYGTTQAGGAHSVGTVFRLPITGGTEQILHSFDNATEGFLPEGALANVGSDLYGATRVGGTGSNCNNTTSWTSCGTVFRVSICTCGASSASSFSTLYAFKGPNYNDGGTPYSGVTFDGTTGMLYGTTSHGGQSTTCTTGGGCGAIFRVSLTGNESLLYSFNGGADGENPYNTGGLTFDGNYVYGTTYYGGLSYGTVFRKKLTGPPTDEILYAFNGSDGQYPAGTPIIYTVGNTPWLYGTATQGGPFANCIGTAMNPTTCGIVYKMKLNGNNPNLALIQFEGAANNDGGHPYSGLTFVHDTPNDWLYGTTQEGGPATCQNALGCGAAFRLHP